jgi:hypothetical protein
MDSLSIMEIPEIMEIILQIAENAHVLYETVTEFRVTYRASRN